MLEIGNFSLRHTLLDQEESEPDGECYIQPKSCGLVAKYTRRMKLCVINSCEDELNISHQLLVYTFIVYM